MTIFKTNFNDGTQEEITFAQACKEIDAERTARSNVSSPGRTGLLKRGKYSLDDGTLYEVPKWMRHHGSIEPGEIDSWVTLMEVMAKRANQKDCGTIGAILGEVISAIKHGWTSELLDAINTIYEPGNGLLEEPIEEKEHHANI